MTLKVKFAVWSLSNSHTLEKMACSLYYVFSSRTAFTDYCLDRFFGATRFLFLFFLLFFRFLAVR